MDTTTVYLYRIYGAKSRLLYVGITTDLEKRLGQHSEKSWWTEVRAIESQTHESRANARAAEVEAIRSERPIYNRAGNTNILPARSVPRADSTRDKQLLSLAEAAEYLGICTRTLRRRISDGTLRGYRVGRLIKVDALDVETLLRPIPTVGFVR